jgi:hypothetical protein
MLDPSLHVGGARAARRSSGAGGKFLIRGRKKIGDQGKIAQFAPPPSGRPWVEHLKLIPYIDWPKGGVAIHQIHFVQDHVQ